MFSGVVGGVVYVILQDRYRVFEIQASRDAVGLLAVSPETDSVVRNMGIVGGLDA